MIWPTVPPGRLTNDLLRALLLELVSSRSTHLVCFLPVVDQVFASKDTPAPLAATQPGLQQTVHGLCTVSRQCHLKWMRGCSPYICPTQQIFNFQRILFYISDVETNKWNGNL